MMISIRLHTHETLAHDIQSHTNICDLVYNTASVSVLHLQGPVSFTARDVVRALLVSLAAGSAIPQQVRLVTFAHAIHILCIRSVS
jgi:hypothetical protein